MQLKKIKKSARRIFLIPAGRQICYLFLIKKRYVLLFFTFPNHNLSEPCTSVQNLYFQNAFSCNGTECEPFECVRCCFICKIWMNIRSYFLIGRRHYPFKKSLSLNSCLYLNLFVCTISSQKQTSFGVSSSRRGVMEIGSLIQSYAPMIQRSLYLLINSSVRRNIRNHSP